MLWPFAVLGLRRDEDRGARSRRRTRSDRQVVVLLVVVQGARAAGHGSHGCCERLLPLRIGLLGAHSLSNDGSPPCLPALSKQGSFMHGQHVRCSESFSSQQQERQGQRGQRQQQRRQLGGQRPCNMSGAAAGPQHSQESMGKLVG